MSNSLNIWHADTFLGPACSLKVSCLCLDHGPNDDEKTWFFGSFRTWGLYISVHYYFQVLEKFLGSVPSQVKYQQQILSMYLSCSGYLEDSNLCLDRVVCEYSDPTSNLQSDERDVVAM